MNLDELEAPIVEALRLVCRRLERLEAATTHPEQAQRGLYVADRAPEGIGIPDSPFLTVAEAARFCRFDDTDNPEHAFRQWAARRGVPVRRRGRSQKLLIERRVLESVLSSE